MIKLYGNPISTCTRKVRMTLEEKGAAYDFQVIDFAKQEQKSPAFLARQPFGVVPALEHDGFEMFESRAICRYLDRVLPGTKLTPESPQDFARMEQYVSIEQSYFSTPTLTVTMQRLMAPMHGGTSDETIVAAQMPKIETAVDVIEKRLAASRFFAGETFSLADIMFMPYTALLFATKNAEMVTSRASYIRWWNEVSARPSWKTVTAK